MVFHLSLLPFCLTLLGLTLPVLNWLVLFDDLCLKIHSSLATKLILFIVATSNTGKTFVAELAHFIQYFANGVATEPFVLKALKYASSV